MPYQQTREQSAEILRQVIPLMSRHHAACHPLSYALWYEYVAGINHPLGRALDTRLQTDAPLIEAEVRRLHARYIASRDALASEEMSRELGLILEGATHSASQASLGVSEFETAIQNRSRLLEQAAPGPEVQRIVAELLQDSQKVLRVTQELCDALTHQAQHVATLHDRLTHTHNEAITDSLSGLRNRRGFERAIDELHETGTAVAGAALIVADLDHFKAINDNHGHLVGDKVIRAVGDILRASIQGRDLAVRLGGEEFAVFLPDTSVAGAVALAERIRDRVTDLRIRRADTTHPIGSITISLGVAASEPNDTLDTLIDRADAAMYAAKRGGRNRVRYAGADTRRSTGSVA